MTKKRSHNIEPSTRAAPSVLLTGCTGFVGQELLGQLLTDTSAHVSCIVRAADQRDARRRVSSTVDRLFGDGAWQEVRPRVDAIRGDVTAPSLGLERSTYERLIARTTHLLHGAASVQFDLSLRAARSINVGGTAGAAEFARTAYRRGRLQRFAYVSTAFVGGRHPGVFSEHDLDVGQRFRNTYEQSKFEAELVVRRAMQHAPITVVRPSIVIGDSRSGATSAFNVIYWPLRLYADGLLRLAPTTPDLPVDLVPVDFVARGALCALFDGDNDTTYALAAGPEATDARTIAATAAEVFDVAPPRFSSRLTGQALAPLMWSLSHIGPWQRLSSTLLQFHPYFQYGSRFDTYNADGLLLPRGVRAPLARHLLQPALDFARVTDFGRDREAVARSEHRLSRARRRALRHRRRAGARSSLNAADPPDRRMLGR